MPGLNSRPPGRFPDPFKSLEKPSLWMVGHEGGRWGGSCPAKTQCCQFRLGGTAQRQCQAKRSPLVSLPGQQQSVSLVWVDQGYNGGVFFSSQYQGWLHSLLIILNYDLGESSYLGCHNHFISNEESIIKGNWLWVRVQTVQSSEKAIWINWSLSEILREAGVCLDFDREKGWRRQEAKPSVRGAQLLLSFFFFFILWRFSPWNSYFFIFFPLVSKIMQKIQRTQKCVF